MVLGTQVTFMYNPEAKRPGQLLNRYRAAVNRAYYAIFSTTNAVLLSKHIERSKHSGVASAFIQNFISDTESKLWGVLSRPPGHHRKLPDPPPPAIAWRRIQLQSWHTWQWLAGATARSGLLTRIHISRVKTLRAGKL